MHNQGLNLAPWNVRHSTPDSDICACLRRIKCSEAKESQHWITSILAWALKSFGFPLRHDIYTRRCSDNYISMLNHLKCSSCFNGFSISFDGPSKHCRLRAFPSPYDLWREKLCFFRCKRRAVCACQCRGLLQLDSKALRALKRMKFNHRREDWKSLEKSTLIDRSNRHWRILIGAETEIMLPRVKSFILSQPEAEL